MCRGQGIPTSTRPKDVPFPTLQLDDAFFETDRLLLLRNLLTDSIVEAKYVKGMYAVRVKGRVPEDVEAELESRNIRYRPRDGTDQD